MRILLFFVTTILVIGMVLKASAQPIAFPGAEGGGKHTTGGRGGKVLFVDNLEDKGQGSLRKAVEARGPRTIVFRVSGNIELSKPIYIKNDSVTIAGQSAPGDGICLVNYGIVIEADNVILRYLRVRPGDKMEGEQDAISGTNQKNILVDHCSFSWSNDETASFYNNANFTLQWCIISESLNLSVHHKGTHGFGGIWGGNNATFHHNLISDHTSRNPRFCGSRYTNKPEEENVDFRNNVVYNWGYNSIYGGEEGNYNLVNNFFKAGPATNPKVRNRILDLTQSFFDPRHNRDTLGAGKFYITGNCVEGSPEATSDNWKFGVQGSGITEDVKAKSKLETPVAHTALKTETAREAFKSVLKQAGASLKRDPVDNRIISEVISGKEQFGATYEGGRKGIIDSPADTGGWPILAKLPPPVDSDDDGMPDNWEKKNRLNPEDASDQNLYSLHRDYPNIEVYLNSLIRKTK